MQINGKIQYAFRRPRFPIICAVGGELVSAWSAVDFQRQIERFEIQSGEVLDVVDATGEGWSFHSDLMIVSPLTFKKRWTKSAVIRLFNESENARRIGSAYPGDVPFRKVGVAHHHRCGSPGCQWDTEKPA